MGRTHTEAEKLKYIEIVKTQHGGNVAKAAKFCGVTKKTLYTWIKQFEKKDEPIQELIANEDISFDDLEVSIIKRIKERIPHTDCVKKLAESFKLIRDIAQIKQDASKKDKVYDEVLEMLKNEKKKNENNTITATK